MQNGNFLLAFAFMSIAQRYLFHLLLNIDSIPAKYVALKDVPCLFAFRRQLCE